MGVLSSAVRRVGRGHRNCPFAGGPLDLLVIAEPDAPAGRITMSALDAKRDADRVGRELPAAELRSRDVILVPRVGKSRTGGRPIREHREDIRRQLDGLATDAATLHEQISAWQPYVPDSHAPNQRRASV